MANSALYFEKTSAYIDIGANATSNITAQTIMCWIKPTLPQATGMIYYNGNDAGGWGMAAGAISDGSGSKLVGLHGSIAWVDSSVTLTDGAWQHVAMSYDGSSAVFYLNGVLAQTVGGIANPNTPTANKATIGCMLDGSNNPSRYYKGYIEELKVFNAVLSLATIAADYAGGIGRYGLAADTNIVALYHINEGTGTTTVDSKNGNTGTLSGTIKPLWELGKVVSPVTDYIRFYRSQGFQ